MEHITSRQNGLLIHLKKLAADGGYRRETGEFFCDSPKLLEEAVRWQAPITAVVSTEPREVPFARCVTVPADVMASVSPMRAPQGVLFSCRLPQMEVPQRIEGRWVVLDGVQDPGNVGTVLRTLDAFDARGLILLPGCADAFGPKTVRAAMGAHFRRTVLTLELPALAALLHRSGMSLYGAALREDTVDARALRYEGAAIAIGSEGRGLSREVLEICDKTVRIPMSPRCESLNAAIAAAVLLWEAYR